MPKKVLLIEYEPRYVERIRALMAPLGHALTEAHDGEAGLRPGAAGSTWFCFPCCLAAERRSHPRDP
jgi:hypothetical protein